jgi:hypothetical protein
VFATATLSIAAGGGGYGSDSAWEGKSMNIQTAGSSRNGQARGAVLRLR